MPLSKAMPARSLAEIIYWGNSALLFKAAATETTKQAGYYFTPLQPVKSINDMDKARRILTKLFTGFYTLLFPPRLQSARGKVPRRHHVQLLYHYRLFRSHEKAEEVFGCKKQFFFNCMSLTFQTLEKVKTREASAYVFKHGAIPVKVSFVEFLLNCMDFFFVRAKNETTVQTKSFILKRKNNIILS